MRISHGCPLDQLDHHTLLVPLDHLGDLGTQPHLHPPLHQILPPCLIKLAEPRKHNHGRHVAHDALLVGRIPHAIRGTRAEAFENDAGHIGRLVAGTQEQRNHGHGNCVCKLLAEEEELEEDLDRDECEDELEPAHNLEHKVELADFALVAREDLGREDVCPEGVVFAEGNLCRWPRISMDSSLGKLNPKSHGSFERTCRFTGSA